MTTLDSTEPASRTAAARGVVVLTAVAAAVAVWVVTTQLLGVRLRVGTGTHAQSVGVAPVAGVTLLAALAGWALLALLEHRTAKARGTWTAVAVGVLLLSIAGPLSASTGAAKASLAAHHAAVAAVVILGMRRSSSPRQAGRA